MTPTQVYEAVERIAATTSIKQKQELLAAAVGDEFFRRVMKAAYNPLVSYGMHEIPSGAAAGVIEWSDGVWITIDSLANRTLTGDEAKTAVQHLMDGLDQPSAALLWRILRKDMRAGFGETLLNKVAPGLIPEFPYMRCSLPEKSDMDKWDWSLGVFSQVKADGMFVNVNVYHDLNVSLHSRQGTPFPLGQLEPLINDIQLVFSLDTQTHGELLVFNGELMLPREQSNGVLNSILQGGELPEGHRVVFYAWDQLPLEEVKPGVKYTTPYKERFAGLLRQMAAAKLDPRTGLVRPIETRVVRSKAEAFDHYRDCLRRGLEGTICKYPFAIWRDGTSKDQVKLKLQVDVDLVVTGFVEGEGKNAATFGSLQCQTSDGLLSVDVSGFTDAMRKQIHAARDSYIGKVITVRANNVMAPSEDDKPHSLYLPRFVEFRSDKSTADTLEQVQDQFKAAVSA